MGTIAEKLEYLNDTKTAIKGAIVAKGVTVSDTDTFRSYANKIGQIQAGGGEPATKFGASVDTWLGDVDENGTLNKTTWTGALNFAGVKTIGAGVLQYAFYYNKRITSVDLSSLQSVGDFGLQNAFDGCTGIASVDLSSLQSVGNYGMYHAFYNATYITGALDLSSLQSVGNSGLQSAFQGCPPITSIDLSSLQSVGDSGLQSAFGSCLGLTTISFPALTDVQSNSLKSTFQYCSAITEIHFRADMQATIEAMSQYTNKWGATNATIYFDL